MKKKKLIRRLFEKTGWTLRKIEPGAYDQDHLCTPHNHDFMADPDFAKAYRRGVAAAGEDYRWHWRVHVGLWAARCASRLPGDFVECGVNKGFLSSAIMEYLRWDSLGKTFYLMDTFTGIDARYVTPEELSLGVLRRNEREVYSTDLASVRANFAQWRNTRIVVGAIPETLQAVTADRIAYLHLDMNCAPPEVAAFHHFWDRLGPGAFVLLDDYAYKGFGTQKHAMDRAAAEKDSQILSLPTGQGLLIKPHP